jgi:hypothetical protein
MKHQPVFFVLFVSLALLMQTLVVIMNHGKCQNFLRIALTVDFQKQTEDLQDVVNADSSGDSGVLGSVKGYFRKQFLRIVMTMREQCSKSSTRRVLLTPRILIRFSQMCLVGALGTIGMLVLNNFSVYPIHLRCGDNEPLTLHYKHSLFHIMVGHGGVFLILFTVVILQFWAEYSVQVKFKKAPCIKDLKAEFRQHNGILFVKRDHQTYGRKLRKMYLRELECIEHDGYKDDPHRAFQCVEWKDPEIQPVILHFKLRKPMNWPFAKNWHRFAAIIMCFMTALCFVSSSQLCWLCVGSITPLKHVTDFQMNTYLNLLGACGRHSPIGTGSLLGAIMLFTAWTIQSLLWKLTDPEAIGNNFPGCHSMCHKVARELYPRLFASQQLWVKIVSETLGDVILDMGVYNKAGVSENDIPEIWCYVWVTEKKAQKVPRTSSSSDDKETEEVIQDAFGSNVPEQEKDRENWEKSRKKWRKSTQPMKVRLTEPPATEESLKGWLGGLVRDEYGIPVLAVKLSDGEKEHRQMIPLQFVAGGPTVWLNLGRKHSWEKVSGALAFGAGIIVLAEVLFSFFYPYGLILSSCDDVLNTQCMYYSIGLEQPSPITFRRSLGTWMALGGCFLAMITCMCIRVANQVDAGKDAGCFCAYLKALWFTLGKALQIVVFVSTSMCKCAYASCKKRCCPVERNLVPEGSGTETELLNPSNTPPGASFLVS